MSAGRSEKEADMWDYSFMLPCALMLFSILAFYFTKRRLPIRLNRSFLTLLNIQLLVMAFDVVSSKIDENYALFSPAALYLANTAYFVLFISRSFCFFLIALHAVHAARPLRPALARLLSLPYVLSVLICATSFATGAVFSIAQDGYHSGPLYNILYACSAFYIASSVVVVARRSDVLGQADRDVLLAYNFILAAGITVRYLLPKVLVMDTFATVAVAFIYLGFTNPDLYLAERDLAFNKRGFRLVLAEAVEGGDCHVLGIGVHNYHQERGILADAQMDEALLAISSWLNRAFPHQAPYYLNAGRFALIGDGSVGWDSIHEQVSARFRQTWETGNGPLLLEVVFVYVNEGSGLTTAERISDTLSLALNTAQQDAAIGHGSNEDSLSIAKVNEQVYLMRSLERALAHNQVEVFLQPVVAGGSRELVGAEALARIRDDQGKLIAPGLFIPMAERMGLIHDLGDQVLDKTCEFIATHDISAMGLQWINVNLSPTQCAQHNIAERFARILERHGVSPRLIHLEMTEQSMVDYALIVDQVKALQAMGFQFSLDDYGSGYSNFTRLRSYPFVNIKLDMAVVRSYYEEHDAILPVIVSTFRDAGYTITAEGIESEEMAVLLTDLGSNYLQGFLFARPMPLEEFAAAYGRRPSA